MTHFGDKWVKKMRPGRVLIYNPQVTYHKLLGRSRWNFMCSIRQTWIKSVWGIGGELARTHVQSGELARTHLTISPEPLDALTEILHAYSDTKPNSLANIDACANVPWCTCARADTQFSDLWSYWTNLAEILCLSLVACSNSLSHARRPVTVHVRTWGPYFCFSETAGSIWLKFCIWF